MYVPFEFNMLAYIPKNVWLIYVYISTMHMQMHVQMHVHTGIKILLLRIYCSCID